MCKFVIEEGWDNHSASGSVAGQQLWLHLSSLCSMAKCNIQIKRNATYFFQFFFFQILFFRSEVECPKLKFHMK